jgi:hypothetical protein
MEGRGGRDRAEGPRRQPDGASEPQKATRRTPLTALVAGASFVALYLWDDAIFAAPVVAATRILGALPAFLALALVYGIASFVIALIAVRAYDRRTEGAPSRLARWLERQSSMRRGRWARPMATSGRALGFVISSFVLGAILTTWLLRYSGQRERITLYAALSSAIFAITFVGSYSGLAQLVFRG